MNYQLTAILLATSPRWFLYQALNLNMFWMLPWAIVVTVKLLLQSTAWAYYALTFVFGFVAVRLTLGPCAFRLHKGKTSLNLLNLWELAKQRNMYRDFWVQR